MVRTRRLRKKKLGVVRMKKRKKRKKNS